MSDIDELMEIKALVDEKTELLNNKIIKYEEDLEKIGIGLQFWVETAGPNSVKIGYSRYGDKWKIMVSYDEHGEPKVLPALNSRRTIRLVVVRHLDKLVPALLKTAKAFVERVDKAVAGEDENGQS